MPSLIFADMKVGGIKLCQPFKFAAPKQAHDASFPFNEFLPPELLNSPIEVDGRKAARIGEILLRERQVEAVVL